MSTNQQKDKIMINAETVDFKEVTDEMREAEKTKNFPSVMPKLAPALAAHITNDSEKMERLRDDLALNTELGLDSQHAIQVKKTISSGIESLYSQHEYPEINRAGLIALFGIKNTGFTMVAHNTIQSLKLLAYSLLCAAPVAYAFGWVHFFMFAYSHGTSFQFTDALLLMGSAASISGVIFAYMYWWKGFHTAIGHETFDEDFRGHRTKRNNTWVPDILIARFLKVGLVEQPAGETSIEIPYGAKLRMKEAKEKNIFDSFSVVHPDMEKIKLMDDTIVSHDPALLGIVTVGKETRKFLISYWDIEKDRERLLMDMNRIRKMKV